MKKTDDFQWMDYTIFLNIFLWTILILMLLFGCTATEITYTEVKTTGGIWEQNDTIIGTDTLVIWRAVR